MYTLPTSKNHPSRAQAPTIEQAVITTETAGEGGDTAQDDTASKKVGRRLESYVMVTFGREVVKS